MYSDFRASQVAGFCVSVCREAGREKETLRILLMEKSIFDSMLSCC